MTSMWNSKIATVMFESKLKACEENSHQLSDYDLDFVERLRDSYNNRDASLDLGLPPWEPSAKQLNYLSYLAIKCGHR